MMYLTGHCLASTCMYVNCLTLSCHLVCKFLECIILISFFDIVSSFCCCCSPLTVDAWEILDNSRLEISWKYLQLAISLSSLLPTIITVVPLKVWKNKTGNNCLWRATQEVRYKTKIRPQSFKLIILNSKQKATQPLSI